MKTTARWKLWNVWMHPIELLIASGFVSNIRVNYSWSELSCVGTYGSCAWRTAHWTPAQMLLSLHIIQMQRKWWTVVVPRWLRSRSLPVAVHNQFEHRMLKIVFYLLAAQRTVVAIVTTDSSRDSNLECTIINLHSMVSYSFVQVDSESLKLNWSRRIGKSYTQAKL
jgi:hypothetical protein